MILLFLRNNANPKILNNPPNSIPLFVDSSPPVSGSSDFLDCAF